MKNLLYGISWRWPLVLALVGASFVLPSMAEGEDGEKCVSKCGEGDKEDDDKGGGVNEKVEDPATCSEMPDEPATVDVVSPWNGPNGHPSHIEVTRPDGRKMRIRLTGIGPGATEVGRSGVGETKYEAGLSSLGTFIPRGSPTWTVGLGRDAQGQFSGQLELRPGRMFETNLPVSAVLELHMDTGTPIDLILGKKPVVPFASAGMVRQIMAKECFVDVQTNSEDTALSVAFYRPSEVLDEFDGNGDYVLSSNANPFVVYDITRSLADESWRTVRVTESRDGLTMSDRVFFRERSASGRVSFGVSEGNGGRVRLKQSVSLQDGTRVVRETLRDQHGAERVTLSSYVMLNGRELLTCSVEDPDGLARTNIYEYVTDPNANGYGFVSRHISPNGKVTEYGYDEHNRKTSKWTRYPSGTLPEERVTYSYVPLGVRPHSPDTADGGEIAGDTGKVEFLRPRREIRYVDGVRVSATLRFFSTDTMNHQIEEEVRLADPSATNFSEEWDSAANLRTYVDYMPYNRCKPCSQRPSLVRHADGRIDKYDYGSGEYAPGADGAAGTFEPVAGGGWFRTVATHYPAQAAPSASGVPFAAVPFVTTRDVTVEIRSSKKVVLTERHVCTGLDAETGEGTFARVSWTAITRDSLGKDVLTVSSDGTRIEKTYAGGRLASMTDADGLTTTYAYDTLGRLVSETRSGGGIRPDTTTTTAYDMEGRVLSRTVSSGGLSETTSFTYDALGRRDTETAADGVVTKHTYFTDPAAGRETHVAVRGWGTDCAVTNETVAYADGRTVETRLNGETRASFRYGSSADHTLWTRESTGPAGVDSPRWTLTRTDALGRRIEERKPGFGGMELVVSNAYDAAGRLAAVTKSCPAGLLESALFCYNGDGAGMMGVRDLDLDGMIGMEHTDQIVSNGVRYVARGGDWWRENATFSAQEDGSSALTRLRTVLTRLTGLGTSGEHGVLASETVSIDAHGGETAECLWRDRAAHRIVQTVETPGSSLAARTIAVCGLETESRTSTGVTTTTTYDALGRPVSVTDGRGNTVSTAYDAQGRITSVTDALGNTTVYGYDALGRRTSETDANGLTATTAYDAEGREVSRRGATYPVDFAYDAYGDKATMTTYRNESLSGGDVTRWLYDEATGLLTNKVYADGLGPSYSYTPDGRLAVRTWARGVTTAYSYDTAGNRNLTVYSDGTPSISCAYDRQGNLASAITEGVATNRYAYSVTGLLTNEWQNGAEFVRTYDALGRPTGYVLERGGIAQSVSYAYDSLGRVASVASGTNVFAYSYLPGSDLVSGYTCGSFSREVSYEPHRDLVSAVTNRFGGRVISSFEYVNDPAGRRIAISRGGEAMGPLAGAVDSYGYNGRNEVVSARRTLGGVPVQGFSEDFAYDPIGNRVSATDYDENGSPRTSLYSANCLNQYVSRTVPGWASVRGLAATNAYIAVNGNEAFRAGGYYFGSDDFDNSAQSGWAELETYAAVNGPTNDLVSAVTNRVFVPQTPEAFAYDADGNLVEDGRFRYWWNGENRMVRAEEKLPPEGRDAHVIVYAYDHQGRNVAKDGALQIWDEYNIIAENAGTENVTYNAWGLDIDGTMQGAGGVGGLLAVARNDDMSLPAYDANGNITEYVDSQGGVVSHTDYSAFGRELMRNGRWNYSHGFSTKPWCRKSGLVEYQMRKFMPWQGRWITREPLGENYAHNLYGYCDNDLSSVDCFGNMTVKLVAKTVKGLVKVISRNQAKKILAKKGTVTAVGKGRRAPCKRLLEEAKGNKPIVRHDPHKPGQAPHLQPKSGDGSHIRLPGAHITSGTALGEIIDFLNPISDIQDVIDAGSDIWDMLFDDDNDVNGEGNSDDGGETDADTQECECP